ncbi:MAG TPA: hypothetical protein VK277_13610 [Acidimicrobiales bacterium]|nr:hypothetical protein [Acidimicrobiales bacterium]
MSDRSAGSDGRRPSPPGPPGLGALYGLGLVGALIWYWRQADGAGEHLVGVLKAFVWPAFLVYGALRVLQGARPEPETPTTEG